MLIGILKEANDTRVATTPEATRKFIKDGHEVKVESGAGSKSFYSDSQYTEAGAKIASRSEILSGSDIVASINPPSLDEVGQMKSQAWVISQFNPLVNKEMVEDLRKLDVLAFSMDRIPRSSIAQSMDVLSSMASIAGYKAVLLAANLLPRYMPMLMTSAGTVAPAKVLVLGAGVAGLQAIATARRLGATVEAFDVRSAVREEVQSLGAKFVEVEGATESKDAGGYAVQQTPEYLKRQSDLIQERSMKADIIISTANIPGRKAPVLIMEDTVKQMKDGSVIVDLAAISGGNCEGTENGKTVVKHGVTIVGESNLPAMMPEHASKLFANNLYNFLKFVLKNGMEGVDFSHEVVSGPCLHDVMAKA